MAAVPGFRHDVFVSYAHADNLPVAGSTVGFISELMTSLQGEIERRVGKVDVWWDQHRLSGNLAVTPEIIAAAQESASIIVVASPAYLRSEWCSRERTTFLELLERRQNGRAGAIFTVRLEALDQRQLPVGLQDLLGYDFYRSLEDGQTTRPLRATLAVDQEPYFNRLSQLSQQIADYLNRLMTGARAPGGASAGGATAAVPTPASGPASNGSQPCVLLMEVTDDLVHRRAELKDYLQQEGIVVLPEKRYSRDDMAQHRAQILEDLGRSKACVQILGPLTGDRSDHPRGMAWLRYETICAAATGPPFLQWRDPDLSVETVTDSDARELLTPSRVRTDRFPDFRREIKELALKPPDRVPAGAQQGVVSVFVNSDRADRRFRDGVAQWLDDHGFMVLEPPESTEDAREDWETNLRFCDSLVFVYGQSKPSWVRNQLLLGAKVIGDPKSKVLCICVAPPRPEPAHDKVNDLALRFGNIHYLRNDDSFELKGAEMEQFASRLRAHHG